MARARKPKTIKAITHDESRKNIPTAEYQSVMKSEERLPIQVAYERRNRDLDPQLVWRGKDEQDAEPLVAQAPPLYIQEKIHPKVLIDSLKRYSREEKPEPRRPSTCSPTSTDCPEGDARTEFYQHEANWSNRMILGDSLHVMASLAEREGLRGKVQCIYMDPPYGIKFNSNFPVVDDESDGHGREEGAHYSGAGAGKGVSGYLAGWYSLVPGVSAGAVDGSAGLAD